MASIENPKGFEYVPVFEPDKKRMVDAIKILWNSSTQGLIKLKVTK
jgi:hypothetical protein